MGTQGRLKPLATKWLKIGDPQLTPSLKHPSILRFHRLSGVLFLFCLWTACIFLFIWKSTGKRLPCVFFFVWFFCLGFLFSFHLSFFFIRWDIASSQPPPNQPYFSPQAFIFHFLRGFAFSHLYRKYTERFIFICLCFLNGSDWLVSDTLTCWGDFKQQPLNQPVSSSRDERKEMHVRMKSFLIYVSE